MIGMLTPNNNRRVCPYCLNNFVATNGNQLYCFQMFGKRGYCKAQMKVLNKIKKQGGRTPDQRLDFLKKHLHMRIKPIGLAINQFPLKKEFRILLPDDVYPTSEFFIEGPYLMSYHQEDNLYLVSLVENATWLKFTAWKYANQSSSRSTRF